MKNKLWDVNASFLVDAINEEEAMSKVKEFLMGDYEIDCNFMHHSVSLSGFGSLKELRKCGKSIQK